MSEQLQPNTDLMKEFVATALTPLELAESHSESEIRDMAAVLNEEIEILSDAIDTAAQQRAVKIARWNVIQEAIPLAAEKGLE